MAVKKRNNPAFKETVKSITEKKNVLRNDAESCVITPGGSNRRMRSTPLNAYDFVGDSPDPPSAKRSKSEIKPGVKKVTASQSKKTSGSNSKLHKTKKNKTKGTMVTPKLRTRKVLPQVLPSDLSVNKKKNKKPLTPIPQPNLEDLSPIVHGTTTTDKPSVQRRVLRSAEKCKPLVETPSVSFIVPRSNLENSNDSAIFVSPRLTMPCFTEEKTSTPASRPSKTKKQTKGSLKAKNTSTPINNKPKKQFTNFKSNTTNNSPVRMETPTSDYGSMELFETPEFSPKQTTRNRKKADSPSPIFSLEYDRDSLSLNKSIDKSYKPAKRKYESTKKTDSKMEEWVEKVNSELEDIENFELSVEG